MRNENGLRQDVRKYFWTALLMLGAAIMLGQVLAGYQLSSALRSQKDWWQEEGTRNRAYYGEAFQQLADSSQDINQKLDLLLKRFKP